MVVHSLFPILLTRDLPGLCEFYERALGGAVDYRFTDDDGEDAYVVPDDRRGIPRHRQGPHDPDGNLVNLGAQPS